MKVTHRCNGIEELEDIAKHLLSSCSGERIFLLEGEMGSGKTRFIRELCEVLGSEDSISSPTFSLVNQYRSTRGNIYHFDLYRLDGPQELQDIGFSEYLDSGQWCFVEWPDLAIPFMASDFVMIGIQRTGSEEGRVFSWELVKWKD